jgi:hypothetical protein
MMQEATVTETTRTNWVDHGIPDRDLKTYWTLRKKL